MNTGKIIADLRDAKGWSQTDLADKSGVSRVMIGKYERDEAVPSIDAAKKIADALEVSLDYLVGEGINSKLDKKTLKRLEKLELLEEDKKHTLFDSIDTYIRDFKARKAYATP
jgi:transcriptional regulator with XRE-family HTH domain